MTTLKTILFLMLAAFSVTSIAKQENLLQSQSGIRCVISVSKQTVLPFESIGVLIHLQNETATAKRVVMAWIFGLSVGEVTVQGVQWSGYRPDCEPLASPPLPSPIEFGPGGSKIQRAHLDYRYPGHHVFEQPGKYEIKGGIGYRIEGRDDVHFESEPVTVTVVEPKGVDAKAYEFLATSQVHKYFSEHTVWKYRYTKETTDQVEEFIARFQKSHYANLARLGLARMWIQGVEGKKDFQKATSLLQQLARSDDKTLVARAQYNLAKLAEEQGKLIEAEKYYSQALSLKIDPYFKYLASQAQVDVKHRLSQPWRD